MCYGGPFQNAIEKGFLYRILGLLRHGYGLVSQVWLAGLATEKVRFLILGPVGGVKGHGGSLLTLFTLNFVLELSASAIQAPKNRTIAIATTERKV